MVDPLILGILGLVFLVVFIFLGVNLPLTFFVIGFFGIVLIKGWSVAFVLTKGIPFILLSSFNWSVIPLFVFMGMIIFQCKIGQEIFHAVRQWLGQLPGGIAAATSGACAIIGTMTGSGAATAALMAKVAYPEMVKYNYDKAFSLATCAASSTAAMMVPPSIQIVVMAILAQVSIGSALLAGFIPGFLSMGIYMVMILIRVQFNPEIGPKLPSVPWKERFISLRYLIPAFAMILIITGGIYFGVFTATEAGGMGAVASLIVAGAMGRLNWARIKAMVYETIYNRNNNGILYKIPKCDRNNRSYC
jgi:tripartite ATP-independent transporter DctM subunit